MEACLCSLFLYVPASLLCARATRLVALAVYVALFSSCDDADWRERERESWESDDDD